MCNHCECENYEKCSIVGFMNIGACCEYCVSYEEEHSCKYYELDPFRLLVSEEKELRILPKAFCLKERARIIKSIELFP